YNPPTTDIDFRHRRVHLAAWHEFDSVSRWQIYRSLGILNDNLSAAAGHSSELLDACLMLFSRGCQNIEVIQHLGPIDCPVEAPLPLVCPVMFGKVQTHMVRSTRRQIRECVREVRPPAFRLIDGFRSGG